MNAMHYAITLPADYDMGVVRRRIATRGPLLDNLPGLGLKAYLVRENGRDGSSVNQYATFYLWASTEGMAGFLWGGRGFGGIVTSFGRPAVRHWVGAGCFVGHGGIADVTHATIREDPIVADADPEDAVQAALEEARSPATGNRLLAIAVDPRDWRIVRFGLWANSPAEAEGTCYEVCHISRPELDTIVERP